MRSLPSCLPLPLALAIVLGLGCNVTTSTCITCFAGDDTRCEKWSGNEPTNRTITARKLCSGEVPAEHQDACKQVLDTVKNGKRKTGGDLESPLVLPKDHFDVNCTSVTRFKPFRGCGGFS